MNCRICKSENLIELLSLGKQYLSEFRDDDVKPPSYPLDLVMCNVCRQVQLKNTVPTNVLYTDNYGYRSGINTTMKNHLNQLVWDVLNRVGWKESGKFNVVDIGSNDGTLLKNYPEYLNKYGYDLVPKFAKDYENTDIIFVNEPFGPEHSEYPKFKIITAISMFYDLDNPVDLMKSMAAYLDDKGIIVIQQNYLLDMLRKNAFCNICHEHLCYHSVHSMKLIVEECGLKIFDVEVNDLNGGSFRTYICKDGDYRISKNVSTWLKEEDLWQIHTPDIFFRFKDKIDMNGINLRNFIKGKNVYLYGASTRINTLLQYYGLGTKWIQKAVERNPEKFGKKIASLGIPIISEEQARKEKPDFMLVGPWFFREEITNREAEYLKNGGKLIFPLPNMEVIDGSMFKV